MYYEYTITKYSDSNEITCISENMQFGLDNEICNSFGVLTLQY